jgi:nicotinamide-nucleotide amidase
MTSTGITVADLDEREFDKTFDALNELLIQEGLQLAVMESCTGGFLAHTITNLPGCGDYFLGGIVSYATEGKIALGVDEKVIEKFGVISGETAEAMASTAREQFGADLAVGITGVAGPKTQEDQPVGTLYVGIAGDGRLKHQRFDLGDNGLECNKRLSAIAAALMLMSALQGNDAERRP